MPLASWRQNTTSAALPKMYHQLAVLRGTGCSAASRMGAASCNRWSNHSAIAVITRMAVSLFQPGLRLRSLRLGRTFLLGGPPHPAPLLRRRALAGLGVQASTPAREARRRES